MSLTIGIDLGTRFTKAFVNDGTNLIQVKSKMGSEKIPTSLGFIDKKFLFGSDAEIASRTSPKNIIQCIMQYVAEPFNEKFKEQTEVEISPDTQGRVSFKVDGMQFTVSECLAYVIEGIVELTGKKAEDFKKFVISIPKWWTPAHCEVLANAFGILEIKNYAFVNNIICLCYDLYSRVPELFIKSDDKSKDRQKRPFVILLDCSETEIQIEIVSISQVKPGKGAKVQIKNIQPLSYAHKRLGVSGITSLIGQYIYQHLQEKKIPEKEQRKYNEFLESLKSKQRMHNIFRSEIDNFKEKISPKTTINFEGTSLTSDFDIRTKVIGKAIMKATVNRADSSSQSSIEEYLEDLLRFIEQTISEIDDENSYIELFEVTGGFGCSEMLRKAIGDRFKDRFEITQRLHIVEAIAEGAARLSQDNESLATLIDSDEQPCFLLKVDNKDGTGVRQIDPAEDYPNISFKADKSEKPNEVNAVIKESTADKTKPQRAQQGNRYEEEEEDEIDLVNEEDEKEKGKVFDIIPPKPTPTAMNHFLSINVKRNTEIKGKIDTNTGILNILPSDAIETTNQFILSESEISSIKDRRDAIKNATKEDDLLKIARNEFESFYFGLKISIKKKKLVGFTPEMIQEVNKLVKSADNWFNQNGENCKLAEINKMLERYKEEYNNIRFTLEQNKVAEFEKKARAACDDVHNGADTSILIPIINELTELLKSIHNYGASEKFVKAEQDKLEKLNQQILSYKERVEASRKKEEEKRRKAEEEQRKKREEEERRKAEEERKKREKEEAEKAQALYKVYSEDKVFSLGKRKESKNEIPKVNVDAEIKAIEEEKKKLKAKWKKLLAPTEKKTIGLYNLKLSKTEETPPH